MGLLRNGGFVLAVPYLGVGISLQWTRRTGRSSICLALELGYFFCFVLESRNGAWIESKFGSLLPRIVRLNHTTGDALEKLLGVCKSTLLSAINVAL